MERITFNSNRVWIAERSEDPDALYAKILICDFSVNLNNVQLERSTINNWLPTLLNQPLVGKIVIKSILHGAAHTIGKGEKFCQLVLMEVPKAALYRVEQVGEIGENRGGGFGSTGLK